MRALRVDAGEEYHLDCQRRRAKGHARARLLRIWPQRPALAWRMDMKVNELILGILSAFILSGCTTTKDFALQRNKDIVNRYFEAWVNRGDPAVADDLIAANLVLRNAPEVIHGLAEDKARLAAFHKAFPDARYSINDTIAEGDRVVVSWTLRGTHSGEYKGRPATGKTFTVTGISILRIAQGKIQEISVNMDRLGMMQQLGWLPTASQK